MRNLRDTDQARERNMIDYERDGSAEFSDLYLRLLRAVLDETNSSLSPRMREHCLAAHVARGISMTSMAAESFSQSRVGYGDTPLL